MDEAEAEARRRFAERAEEVRENLEEAFFDALPGNHSPADAVLLAHLMTATDGYNNVQFVAGWDKRAKTGWTTSMAFLAQLHPGQIVPFAAETRYNDHARQLAILIDRSRPGERLPAKLQQETGLVARGYRVIAFTELEILSSPEGCRERVEGILFDMVDEVLVDGGVIRGPPDKP